MNRAKCLDCNRIYNVDFKKYNTIRCQCGTHTRLVKCYSCGKILRTRLTDNKFRCSCGDLIEFVKEYIPQKLPCRIKRGYVGLHNKQKGRIFR